MITHDVSGLLVPPGDVRAMGDALLRLNADPTVASQLGREAHRVAKARNGLARHLEMLDAEYDRARRIPPQIHG